MLALLVREDVERGGRAVAGGDDYSVDETHKSKTYIHRDRTYIYYIRKTIRLMQNRRKVLMGIGGSLALAGCTGASDEEPEPVDETNGDDTNEDNDETEAEARSVNAVVGELVSGDQMELVIESFDRDVDFGDFYDADAGNEFVLVRIALKNTSDDYLSVSNLLQTRMRDDEDYQYSQTFAPGDEATFNDGQFVPGEVERGGIPFEIPEDASELELVFDFNVSIFGGVDRVTIDLEQQADTIHKLTQELAVDVYDVSETISFGDVEVTVNEMRTESELGSFAEPDSGNEYVIVNISIANNTGEEQRFSTILQMMVKDDDGHTYQEDIIASSQLDRGFDEGTPLSDSETRRGELVYEIEEGLSPIYWVFEFALFATGDKTFWQLR